VLVTNINKSTVSDTLHHSGDFWNVS